MSAESFTFELFRQEELVSIFQETWPDLILVGNILTDPPQIVGIYKRFLQHYNCFQDWLDCQMLSTAYPIHDGHDLHAIKIYYFVKRFAPVLQINDFCLTDVLGPGPKRARRILSAMANFILFTRSAKREEFVQELNDHYQKSQERFEWTCKEIDRLTALQNQYLIEREQNEAEEGQVDRQLAEQYEKLMEAKEAKSVLQKELTRRNEEMSELGHRVQEETAKRNKVSQEEEDHKKLIVKSPEAVQAEKKQAQDELQKALERQKDLLVRAADYNQQDAVLDELYEELPYISKVRDQLHACWETKKQLDKLQIESANMRDKVDKKLEVLASQKDALSERAKSIKSNRIGLTKEKQAYCEEISLLDSALIEKKAMFCQESEQLEKLTGQRRNLENQLQELELQDAETLKKVEEEKKKIIAEADRFDEEVLKMSRDYAKTVEKFHNLPSRRK